MTLAILLRRALSRPGQHDEEQILGPCERGALVVGLALAAQRGEEAIAIAVGPARREDRVLAMALRAGCARALRVWDDGLDDLDYLGLAEVLAAAVRSIAATAVVCGDRSVDERGGAIGPAVAEVLGFGHLTSVAAARWSDGAFVVEHRGAGEILTLRLPGPLVLATIAPVGRGRDDAAPAPATGPQATGPQAIVSKDLAELGVEPRRLTPRRALIGRLRPLRVARQATIFPDAPALVERLRRERVLGAEPTPPKDEAAP